MDSRSVKAASSPPETAQSRQSTPRSRTPHTVSPFSRWTPTIVRPSVGRPRTAGHSRPPRPTPPPSARVPRVGSQLQHELQSHESAQSTVQSARPPPETQRQDPPEALTPRNNRMRPMSAPSRRSHGTDAYSPSVSTQDEVVQDDVSESDTQDLMPPDNTRICWKRKFFSKTELDGSGPTAFEVILCGSEPNQLACDYLTWYYCDFFEAEPAEKLPLSGEDTTTVTKIVDWLNRFRPRTRVDAYPMLQVALDVIRKLTRQELKIEYEHYDTFKHEIEKLEVLAGDRQNTIETLQEENKQLTQIVSNLKTTLQHMDETHEMKTAEIRAKAEQREQELTAELERVNKEKDATIKDLDKNLTTTKEDLFHFKTQLARTAAESKAFQQRMASLQKELREIEAKNELEKAMVRQGQQEDKRKWVFQNIARTTITAHFTSWRVLAASRRTLGREIDGSLTNLRRRAHYRHLCTYWLAWDETVTRGHHYRDLCRKALGRVCGELFRQWVEMVAEVRWEAARQRARGIFRKAMDRSLNSITSSWRGWARKEAQYKLISRVILGRHQLLLLRIAFRVLRHLVIDNLLQQSGWTGTVADRKPPPKRPSTARPAGGKPEASPRGRQDPAPRATNRQASPRSPRLGGKRVSRRDLLAAADRMRGGHSPPGAIKKPPVDFSGVPTSGLAQAAKSAAEESFLKHISAKVAGLGPTAP